MYMYVMIHGGIRWTNLHWPMQTLTTIEMSMLLSVG